MEKHRKKLDAHCVIPPDMHQEPEPDDNRGHEMLGWVILFAAVFYVALGTLIWWVS